MGDDKMGADLTWIEFRRNQAEIGAMKAQITLLIEAARDDYDELLGVIAQRDDLAEQVDKLRLELASTEIERDEMEDRLDRIHEWRRGDSPPYWGPTVIRSW